MKIGNIISVNTKEDTCEVLFPDGKIVYALLFTDKVPDIGSAVIVVKDEFSQMHIIVAVKNDFKDKTKAYTNNPFIIDRKNIVETSDKLPGDIVLITENGAGLHLMASGVAVLKTSPDNLLLMENETNQTLLKSNRLIIKSNFNKIKMDEYGFYLENGIKNSADNKLFLGDTYTLLKNYHSTNRQLKLDFNTNEEIVLINRKINPTFNNKPSNQSGLIFEPTILEKSEIKLTPDNKIMLTVSGQDDSSTQIRKFINIVDNPGEILIEVGEVNINSNDEYSSEAVNNHALIRIKDDYTINVEAAGDVNVTTQSNFNVHADGNININANGNIKLTGARIDLN